jgi:dolichyl-diphosphooligosaccharide--protein glycosyltransferase
LSSADIPPSIANGGTGYRLQTNDWIDTLNWIAKDTPKNSVIAAWRDYGYWITTLGHKTSLADNATINQTRIATIAKMFIDQKENGIKIAQDLKADYILVFVVGQRFSGVNGTAFYTLGSGGDESKKQWFMRIGGFDETNYLQADGFTATPRFWNTTLLGQIIPFTPQAYATFQGGQLTNLQPNYAPRTVALYVKHIKFPVGSNPDNQPLSLVYSSPSFQSNNPGLVFGVLVYKVNHNYVPKITSNPYHEVFVNVTQQPSQQQLKPLQPFSPSSSHPIRSSIPSSGQGTPITNNVTGIFNQVKNSIVQISARANPSEGISTRIESGFIYDTQGHIFTTNDVINGDNTALVAFADGNTYSAKVIGTDPSNDLAVLQITDNFSHENLVPLSMANSYGLQVGQQVIAIGHPFGLNYTMTTGIITQWVRLHFPATGYSISDVIQSNAPINPGSFGGPLLNRDGQVIGMNIAISSSTGEFSGIGFAIPSNIIISEVPRIIQTGTCSNCTR